MRIVILAAITAAAACSSQPRSAEPTEASVPVTPSATAAEITASAMEESEQFQPPYGYETKKRGATTVYCRDEVVVGTRFPTEYCFTQAQLKDLEGRRKSMQDDVARRQRMCTTGSSCGGN